MVRVFVPDLAEFRSVLTGVRNSGGCTISGPAAGYWRIEADRELCLGRRTLGLGPALWNSLLTGGFRGRIVDYDRDTLRIVSADT